MTTYPPLDVLKPIGDGIRVIDSGPLHASSVLPLPVRMTVMQLEDGGIILHSYPARASAPSHRQIAFLPAPIHRVPA